MDFLVEGVRPREYMERVPKSTWKEVVEVDMRTLKLSKEDVLVRGKWRQLI